MFLELSRLIRSAAGESTASRGSFNSSDPARRIAAHSEQSRGMALGESSAERDALRTGPYRGVRGSAPGGSRAAAVAPWSQASSADRGLVGVAMDDAAEDSAGEIRELKGLWGGRVTRVDGQS